MGEIEKNRKINVLYDYQAMTMQRYGGVSRYFYEIINYLSSMHRCKVTIAAIYFKSFYFYKNIRRPFHQIFSRHFGYASRMNIRATKLALRKRYHVVHATFYDDLLALKKHNGKLVATIHDMIQEIYPEEFRDVEKVIANKKAYIYEADKLIAVSECTKRDILKFYPDIPKEKIAVIYHGSSMKFNRNTNLSIDLPARYLLYMGARNGYKNFDGFCKAISVIMKKDTSLYLICGGDKFKDEEIEMLKMLNIFDKTIQMAYSDEELPTIYNKALCFVYPSRYEGFGIPILEAWACDCPIVISNSSCFPEVAGDAAIYFNPDDTRDMEQKISMFIENQELRNHMVKLGRERLAKFSWEKTAEETYELYKDLIVNSF